MDNNLDSLSEISAQELASLYEEMVRSGLTELEVRTPSGGKWVLKRKTEEVAAVAESPTLLPKAQATQRKKSAAKPDDAHVQAPGKQILSPIMGVFYRSSSPQSAPFAKEGDTVQPGTTLCIVEAMKVMNEIKADSRYKILKILVDNAKPVASGQPLFQVEAV